MYHLPHHESGDTIYCYFATYGGDRESITITGLAVTDVEIYKDGSTTQRVSDNGYSLLDTDGIDFDGVTGIHGFTVDTSDNSDAGFYANGSNYLILVNAITVDAQTVVFAYNVNLKTTKVTLADTAHGGTAATITLERLVAVSTTTNQPAFSLTGDGTGAGLSATGGPSAGAGVHALGGTGGDGFCGTGNIGGSAMNLIAGSQGNGLKLTGGSLSGDAFATIVAGSGDHVGSDAVADIQAGLFLAAGAPTNFSSLVISVGGAVDSLVQGFLNNTIAETTTDNIASNFETFYDNADVLTSKTIDNVGGSGGPVPNLSTESTIIQSES